MAIFYLICLAGGSFLIGYCLGYEKGKDVEYRRRDELLWRLKVVENREYMKKMYEDRKLSKSSSGK